MLFANRDEAAALVGARNLPQLLELAPIVVIKAGAAGCTVLWGEEEMIIRARPFKTTDTTGAGDAFDAGFLHAYIGAHEGTGAGGAGRGAAALRRAAVAGQRAASAFLGKPRVELTL